HVVATLALDYDVGSALAGELGGALPREPTHLVWQATGDETVRLLRVDRFIYETLEALAAPQPVTAGELVLARFADGARDASGGGRVDAAELLEALAGAAREGLIRT